MTVAQLKKAVLLNAHLLGTNLQGVQLSTANLIGARLQGANLSWARLYGAFLFGSNRHGQPEKGAQLQGAVLSYAHFQGAELPKAQLQGVFSSELRPHGSFAERMRSSIGQQSDLSGVVFEGGLVPELVDTAVEGLSDIEARLLRNRLEPHIDKPASHELPKDSGAITGAYTAEEAEQWIAEYEEAMSERGSEVGQ